MHITASRASAKLALPLVLVAAAAAGGCGAGTHPPVATAPAAAQPIVTSPGQAAAAAPQPVISTGPVVRMFTGAGSQAIGSLSEHRLLVIDWKVAKPPVQIYTAHGNLLLSSDRRSGAIRLARGEYRQLRIATNGHWTIQLRAAA
jgi:hypothetical protein